MSAPQDCPGCAAPDLAFAAHDHAHCAQDALARAEALTATTGARLTPVRRRVLEILLEEHKALGAYDVLARLATEGFGNQPPVAYRALEFLVEQGLAHRIQRLNAFTACVHPGEDHAPAFLICRTCHTVAEAEATAARAALDTEAARTGFQVERSTIEALGLCPNCRGQA
ncbi:Fur family transcriptional regulator [Tabrizicola thermarum]|uniref:Fur family transcriptional regulator n=1 Tax=Tabrizicola thermarum TaxID=2670345 RepID=UPI000FFBDC0B|nr:Fur family transcriptional regulator [Tabrizicola thermarum]